MALVLRCLQNGTTIIDVPAQQGVGPLGPLEGNGPVRALMWRGATADRPNTGAGIANWPPLVMFDTTLGEPIFFVVGSSPNRWIDITGAPV